jgi:DNA mismatch repair protein MutS2
MVQHRHLRILHGKGNGILRQLVREYLATLKVVKSFRDENVESGGSGITVVEMDI